MKTLKPPRLQKGDTVGIMSPSNNIYDREDSFRSALKVLEKTFDINFRLAPHALGRYHYSSGTIEERVGDFHTLIADSSVKAIWFSVGGETAIELVDQLDYELIKNNPKIIAGLSDCTTLLTPIQEITGLITFHGLEINYHGMGKALDYHNKSMQQVFFDGSPHEVKTNPNWYDNHAIPTSYRDRQEIYSGKASGQLVGGNLGCFVQLMGTKYGPTFQDKILFFETYKYDKKQLHRALFELRLHGVFEQISGLIVGYLVGSDDPGNEYNQRPLKDVVLEVTEGYTFPIMQVGEIGHYVENAIIPIGALATIDTGVLSFTIDEAVVI